LADKNIESKLDSILREKIELLGYELYDIEYVKEGKDYFLRVYIDSESGISIDDCEKVNNVIDPLLDKLNLIGDSYFLEVSSCGLEKNLRKDIHFEKAVGKNIEIKLYQKVDNKKVFTGKLESFENGKLKIADEESNVKEFTLKDIASAKTIYEW